jgi:glycosyltransferase involved in cell wall biosynthesis
LARRLSTRRIQLVVLWFTIPQYSLPILVLVKLFNRKLCVITGGFDVTWVPEIRFGLMGSPVARWLQRLVLTFADLVLPFSKAAKREVLAIGQPRAMRMIYPGIDTQLYSFSENGGRQDLALTVCAIIDQIHVVQKGIDVFVEAASLLPEIEFVIVGRSGGDDAIARLRASAPPNVRIIERYLSNEELAALYRTAKVYVQPSYHEGFGIAVAEAMASGCIPVVANVGSLPEVVGDVGLTVPPGDATALAEAIRTALTCPKQSAARGRVVERFSSSRRERELLRAAERLIGPSSIRDEVEIDLGCGWLRRPWCVGVDLRAGPGVDVVADARQLPFGSGTVRRVYASQLLEHFEDPYEVLDEVHRVLADSGELEASVPGLGTYSAHLDRTHMFLADLAIWKDILKGYFEEVRVSPMGTKYRDNRVLVALNIFVVYALRWHELAQGWTFTCRGKRATPERRYLPWWIEGGRVSYS